MPCDKFLRQSTSAKCYDTERNIRAFFTALGFDEISELHTEVKCATGLIPYHKVVAFRVSLKINKALEGFEFVRRVRGKDERYEVFVDHQLVGNLSIEAVGYHSRLTLESIPEDV